MLKNDESVHNKNKKPAIIKWKDTMMVKNHSVRAVADEIMNMSANQDLISINMIGKQATGKTELAKTLCHLVHQMAAEKYGFLHLGRKELQDLENVIKSLKPMNYQIIFDDIAFLKANMTNKDIDKIQAVLAEIRHLNEKDVRIIIYKLFQYTKAIPPFLRQNDMTFYSSVDDNETQSVYDVVGKHNITKVNLLRKMQVQVKLGKAGQAYFHYPLGNKGKFYHKYHARHPFLPYLYWNGISARIIVSPLRTWIDPQCNVCDPMNEQEKKLSNKEAIFKDFDEKWGGKQNSRQAARVVLKDVGINTYNKNVVSGVKYLQGLVEKRLLDPKDIAEHFDLKETRTSLSSKRKPSEELLNPLKENDTI